MSHHDQVPGAGAGRHRIDRRRFIVGAAVVAASGTGAFALRRAREANAPVPWDRDAFPPPTSARVAVLRADSYDADLEGLLEDGLREVGAEVRGARVLLKPNLVEYDPGTSVNTDPRMVAAAIVALRRLGASKVTCGEGPGHRRDTRYVVDASGLADALAAVEAPFVDLNLDAASIHELRSRYTTLGQLWLPRAVTDADVVVSMPKMKTHHWASVTLSMKNLFGCLPSRLYGWPKNVLHWEGIEQSILDITGAVRPALQIVDGIVGMEGNGPINGTPKQAGLIVIGNDPVATDHTATRLMGFDPSAIVYLDEAARFLGTGDRDAITQVGEDPEPLVTPFVAAPGNGEIDVSG